MRESFVLHAEYIEDLPEEFKITYLQYIYDYGINDKVPEGLEGFEKSIWIKIQRRIDSDRESYEERKEKNRKRQEEWRKKKELLMSENTETSVPVEKLPSTLTPSQGEYSKRVFKVFSDADLPCSKNNEISFMQTDFMNGLSYLHRTPDFKGVTPDDVIQACKNYVEVLEDSSCYVTTRMNFFSLVKSKLFYNFLPANYNKQNFKNFRKNEAEETPQQKWYEDKPCPSCGKHKIIWHNDLNKYICESCNKSFSYGEF